MQHLFKIEDIGVYADCYVKQTLIHAVSYFSQPASDK